MSTTPSLLIQQPTSQKPALKGPLILMALMFAAGTIGVRWMRSQSQAANPIFHQTKSGWEQLPAPVGFPEKIRVSASGTVYIHTWGPTGLRRWDGSRWRYLKDTERPTKTTYVDGNFVLDAEQVWAPTLQGVLHWDGQRWHSYRDVAPGEGASIVAGDGQVWIVDSTGKLFHFEKDKWVTQKPKLPGQGSQQDSAPQLARTSDGTVWLVWQRVWRLCGDTWLPVIADHEILDNVTLLGAAGNRLWLLESSGIRAISSDSSSPSYSASQTGIPDDRELYDVASDGRLTWFGSNTGLVEFDGSHWRSIPRPSERVPGIHAIAAAPDGSLWAIGTTPGGLFKNARYLLYLTFLWPLGILGAVIWFFQRLRKRQLQQHQRVAQAVQHVTGEVPAELEIGQRKLAGSGVDWLITIFGSSVGYFLLRRVWPQAPVWMFAVLALSIHLLITLQQSLVKRKPKAWDPIGPGAPSQYDWAKTLKSVGGALFFVLIFNADRFPALRFLRGYWFWALLAIVVGFKSLGMRLMNQALRKGDYDGALRIIRWFHFYNPSGADAMTMSGHILLLAGRYREAEDALRRSFTSSQAGPTYAAALEFLGDTLMEQGRYDEAKRSFEAALHTFTWMRRPYRGMAEMLLRQGKDSGQALQCVESIIDFTGLSHLQVKNNGRPQDDYWALKAWALARDGRSSEVADAIEKALKATSSKCLPDLATTHYRAGMAMQALGNMSEAHEHFRRAVEFDPQGRRGTLANAALKETSVWGAVPV